MVQYRDDTGCVNRRKILSGQSTQSHQSSQNNIQGGSNQAQMIQRNSSTFNEGQSESVSQQNPRMNLNKNQSYVSQQMTSQNQSNSQFNFGGLMHSGVDSAITGMNGQIPNYSMFHQTGMSQHMGMGHNHSSQQMQMMYMQHHPHLMNQSSHSGLSQEENDLMMSNPQYQRMMSMSGSGLHPHQQFMGLGNSSSSQMGSHGYNQIGQFIPPQGYYDQNSSQSHFMQGASPMMSGMQQHAGLNPLSMGHHNSIGSHQQMRGGHAGYYMPQSNQNGYQN